MQNVLEAVRLIINFAVIVNAVAGVCVLFFAHKTDDGAIKHVSDALYLFMGVAVIGRIILFITDNWIVGLSFLAVYIIAEVMVLIQRYKRIYRRKS